MLKRMNRGTHYTMRVFRMILACLAGISLSCCSSFGGGGEKDMAWASWVDSVNVFFIRQDSALATSALDNARAYAQNEWQRAVIDAYDAVLDCESVDKIYACIRYFESEPCAESNDSSFMLPRKFELLARLYEKAASAADLQLDMVAAIKTQGQAVAAARRSGGWPSVFSSEMRLLWMKERAGDYDASVNGYLSLITECRAMGDSSGEVESLFRLCLIFLRMGDVATAQIYLDAMEAVHTSSPVDDCRYWLATSYVCKAGVDSVSYANAVGQLTKLRRAGGEVAKSFGLTIDCVTADYFLNKGLPDSARGIIGYAFEPEIKFVGRTPSRTFLKIFETRLCVREGRLDRAKELLGGINPESLRRLDINLYELYADAASELFAAAGDDKSAYEYIKDKTAMLDSLRIEMTNNGLAFKTLESRRASAIAAKVQQIDKAEGQVEKVIIGQYVWLIFAVLCIVIPVVVYYLASLRRVRRLNAELERQREELTRKVNSRRNTILEHKWQLEAKSKSMQSELFFAKYVQSSILSRESILSAAGVAEHFVFFRPCFQVSGDFYWFYDGGDKLFVCAADATGHGIPGAFISMVASAILTDIASNSDKLTPAAILENLSVSLSNVLRNNTDIVNADSVDMSVLCIDRLNRSVSISMARHVAYIVKADGTSELVQGTKRCVGEIIEVEDGRPFTDIILDVKPGDCVYLASDGFVSQFGGPDNQKFKRKRLETLLTEVHGLPAERQKEAVTRRFDDWKGNCDQTDDVLLIGIRIGELS